MEYQYSDKIRLISRIRIRTGFLTFDPGSELLGTLKLPAYDIVKKAKQNADAPVLNYSACLSNPVKLSSGRHSRARMLLWVVLGED